MDDFQENKLKSISEAEKVFEKTKMTFEKNIESILGMKSLSKKTFANKIGKQQACSYREITDMGKGITLFTLIRIANGLNLSVSQLLEKISDELLEEISADP